MINQSYFFLLAEIFANCRVYNFFHSSLHKFPWQLKTIRSLGKGELELDEKKKQFQFQFRRKEKTIRNFNYSTKFFPLNPRSKISASTWCHSSQFFFKKKKRIQNCKLTSRKKNEKSFRRILEGLVTFIPACNATSTNKSRACFGI